MERNRLRDKMLPPVTGYEEGVDRIAQARHTIDMANRAIDEARPTLEEAAMWWRQRYESRGSFSRSVDVAGNDATARFVFRELWLPVPTELADATRRSLGQEFTRFFREGRDLRVRPGAADEVLRILGDRAGDLLEEEGWVRPVPDLRATRFMGRGGLTRAQARALDRAIGAIATRPMLLIR